MAPATQRNRTYRGTARSSESATHTADAKVRLTTIGAGGAAVRGQSERRAAAQSRLLDGLNGTTELVLFHQAHDP